MSEMKTRKHRRALIVAVTLLLAASLGILTPGCGGGAVSREKVMEIDTAFREGNSELADATAFMSVLDDFSLENAAFYDDMLAALESGRDAASKLLESVERLRSIDYAGTLEKMGQYMGEYCDAVVEAVVELEAVYDSLQDILEAIEPILREEAVITQLEAPQSNDEWLQRLYRLEAAAGTSVTELAAVEVPPLLIEYKTLLDELFSTLHKLTVDIISIASGQAMNIDMENNPDFIHMQELQETYSPVVEGISERLKIFTIDPFLEEVELEINRLYLEENE